MSIDTDEFATQLRARLDLDALRSTIDPAAALARGQRSARRRAMAAAACGVVGVVALGAAAFALPGLQRSAPAVGPGTPSAASTAVVVPDTTIVQVAEGVVAATGVTGDGSLWDTGLSLATAGTGDEVRLGPGTEEDLAEVSAGGAPVDHALRVIVGDPSAPSASVVVAWADDARPAAPRSNDPSNLTLFQATDTTNDDGLVRANRLFAGVVPAWMPDARVVFFTAEAVSDATGAQVHAVEIPTFADPGGSGARVYVALASADVFAGPRPRGIFFVTPDGTFADAEDTCTTATATEPNPCTAPRADGLDLRAELLSAIQP